MAKILAVDDDALARAVLVDALRGMHHEVVPASGGREALERLRKGGFALVITDVMMPEMDGIELARHVAAMEKAPPVLLASGVRGADVTAEARGKGVDVAGFVPKPLHADVLSKAIRTAMGTVSTRSAWTAEDLAADREATFADVPPARTLFLVHRVGATGTLRLRAGTDEVGLVVRAGRVVHLSGVPGLASSLGGTLPDVAPTGVFDPEEAGRVAALALGAWIARAEDGDARWETHAVVPVPASPLDTPLPRVLALGLREARPINEVRAFWSTADSLAVEVAPPQDVPESRWGLDMTALRVLRLGSRYHSVGELIAAAVGNDADRRPDVLRAMDFLHHLGLLRLSERSARPAPEPRVAPRRTAEADAEADTIVAGLRELATSWRDRHPVDVLGLGDRAHVTLAEVNAAWRDAASEVHPDRFKTTRPDVRLAAEECFEALRKANEAICAPGGLDDANAFLDARARGLPYVTDKDRAAAKVALRRGETLFRAREWKAADAAFLEAVRLDPTSWPGPFLVAWCGWLSRRLSPAEALQALEPLTPKYPREVAEVHVVRGTILKLEGKVDAALAEFRLAAEKDPNNRDALRELRLHERRSQPVAPAGNTLLDNLRTTLTRPIGKP